MFSRIFNIHSKKDASKVESPKEERARLDEFQAVPRLGRLDKNGIRVLIFKDCERRADKTLLFDSDAVTPAEVLKGSEQANVRNCKNPKNAQAFDSPRNDLGSPQRFQCLKPNSDVKMLGEMIFGSVAMAYKGSILKVHLIRSPPQLLMTKVFALRARSVGVNFCDSELSLTSSGSVNCPQINISSDSISMDSTNASPVDMIRSYSNPIGMKRSQTSSLHQSSNSCFSNPRSLSSFLSSGYMTRSVSTASLAGCSVHSSCGSYKRRFVRSQRTSLDSSQVWRNKAEQSEELRSAFKQQPKVGIGIIFKLWDNAEDNRLFQNFFFTHFMLFESHLQTLRIKIEKSFYLRQKFIDTAMTAVECFQDDVLRICYAPRIVEPVWLNLMTIAEHAYLDAVEKFMKSFINLVEFCDKKENNYFLSILLTAVLTHHSSWVATVASTGNNTKRTYLDKYSSNTLDVLARCHPYNPLWAQLCDLYGSTGSPIKLARTIIVGKNSQLICELIKLLTYFIRCSDIKEKSMKMLRDRDSMYRFSGSSWSETSCTPNSVLSWIDSNEVMSKITSDSEIKTSYCGTKSCSVNGSEGSFIAKNNLKNLLNTNLVEGKCYCSVLKQLDTVGEKDLKCFLRKSDNKEIKDFLLANYNEINTTSKSCQACRTLEKPIDKNYCDQCRYLQEHLTIEIDSICHACMKHNKDGDHNGGLLQTDSLKSNTTKHIETKPYSSIDLTFLKKPTFQCYCCSKKDKGLVTEVILEDSCCMDDITPRTRKMSDPVDCVIGPKFKIGTLRNSTASHDSGTEMTCSISSGSHEQDLHDAVNLTRNNSLSSHDDVGSIDQIVADMDSDYCSVDNEQLASTLKDTTGEFGQVSKSVSSTTLKDMPINLSSSLEKSDHFLIKEENEPIDMLHCELDNMHLNGPIDMLHSELDNMHLKEVPMLRTSYRQDKSSKNGAALPEPPTFGKSLFAGYNKDYLPNFVVQGVRTLDSKRLATDLQNSVKHSILDEPVADAVCIVANVDTWQCDLWTLTKRRDSCNQATSESLSTKPVFASGLVSSMIETTKELWDMKMAPHFCLLHVEEQLKDIYNGSQVLSEYGMTNDEESTELFMNKFGYHANDIELLKGINCGRNTVPVEDVF